MDTLASSSSLKEDKDNRSDNRNEVERKVHEVPDNRLDAEFPKRTLQSLAQPLDWVTARFQLSALLDELTLVSREQSTVKGVKQSLL